MLANETRKCVINSDTPQPRRPRMSDIVHANLEPATGRGAATGHHGELLQGLFLGDEGRLLPGLVTLPLGSLRSTATFTPTATGSVDTLDTSMEKAARAAILTLHFLQRHELGGTVDIHSNIPRGRGLGSSTADVVATIRAVHDSLRVSSPPSQIAALAVQAEVAADSTMFDRPVLFAQRHGRMLEAFQGRLPTAFLIGFDTADPATTTPTLDLKPIEYSTFEVQQFAVLRAALRHAFRQGDADLLGTIATASTRIHLRHRSNPVLEALLPQVETLGACGLQVSHSGTISGLLYPLAARANPEVTERATRALWSAGATATWGCSVGGFSHAKHPQGRQECPISRTFPS